MQFRMLCCWSSSCYELTVDEGSCLSRFVRAQPVQSVSSCSCAPRTTVPRVLCLCILPCSVHVRRRKLGHVCLTCGGWAQSTLNLLLHLLLNNYLTSFFLVTLLFMSTWVHLFSCFYQDHLDFEVKLPLSSHLSLNLHWPTKTCPGLHSDI